MGNNIGQAEESRPALIRIGSRPNHEPNQSWAFLLYYYIIITKNILLIPILLKKKLDLFSPFKTESSCNLAGEGGYKYLFFSQMVFREEKEK
jgi:hypothetical protein